MLRQAKDLERFELRARDGVIGHVDDLFFDDVRWTVRYVSVATGSWLEQRTVLIAPASVQRVEWDGRLLAVNLTQEQVRQSPGVDPTQPLAREHEAALAQYYSWPAYWGVAGFSDMGFLTPAAPLMPETLQAQATAEALRREASRGQPTVTVDHHLRSVRAVTGHAVSATDGEIGHVHEFLIDDASWEIRYLVIDTRNWWPGRKVVVSPRWIREVGWNEAKVFVDLTREAIKSSPAYDPLKPLTQEYAGHLHQHYRRPPPPGFF